MNAQLSASAAGTIVIGGDLMISRLRLGQMRTREHLREAFDHSLTRLRLEQIPVYQLHKPDPKVPLAESIGALANLKAAGEGEP